jgi:hypothetical protein
MNKRVQQGRALGQRRFPRVPIQRLRLGTNTYRVSYELAGLDPNPKLISREGLTEIHDWIRLHEFTDPPSRIPASLQRARDMFTERRYIMLHSIDYT